MTPSSHPHLIAEIHKHRDELATLRVQHSGRTKRRTKVATDQARNAAEIEELTATANDEQVAAILADVPYEVPAAVSRRLRDLTAKGEAFGPALAALDAEIAALADAIGAADRKTKTATFNYSTDLQREAVAKVKAALVAVLPAFAELLAVDLLRERHASGALVGIPAGGDRPWSGTAILKNLLKNLPEQVRPAGLTLEAVQRQALTIATKIENQIHSKE